MLRTVSGSPTSPVSHGVSSVSAAEDVPVKQATPRLPLSRSGSTASSISCCSPHAPSEVQDKGGRLMAPKNLLKGTLFKYGPKSIQVCVSLPTGGGWKWGLCLLHSIFG